MPSHIFTRVGAWEESIESNRASAKAAMSELGAAQGGYASYNALHAMDYMTYGYLQLGRDREARAVVEEVGAIRKIDIDNFAAAFAFAAIPARYTLERGRFADAAALTLHPADLGWQRFPQAESLHCSRAAWAPRGAAMPRAPARRSPAWRRSATRWWRRRAGTGRSRRRSSGAASRPGSPRRKAGPLRRWP